MNNLFKNSSRVLRQWLLAPIVIITIGLGWKYYWLAFSVPIVMFLNMLSPILLRGRFVCGNFCPRGAFFDRILKPLSNKRKIPTFLMNKKFRWSVFAIIFGNFIFQISHQPLTIERLAYIFWLICAATTAIAIILAIFYNHRTWCAFCPVGTFIGSVGKDEHRLIIDVNSCISCRLCERRCPLNIAITDSKAAGKLTNSDCLKCGECVAICPKKSLRLS